VGDPANGVALNPLMNWKTEDAGKCIEHIMGMMREKARSRNGQEIYPFPYKQKVIYNVEHLTEVYFRNAIYSTRDEEIMEELYHATDWGLRLLASFKGYGDTSADSLSVNQLWVLHHFMEIYPPLYKILIKKI
jgi:hypothetical protein